MAQKRMFSLDIVDTDLFLDMPSSTQNLYFHLGMRADDDGFVSSPKKITGMVNCSNDDLKLLIAKNLIIAFEIGVIVIRDWKTNNYIAKDRYKKTKYANELASLDVDINGFYKLVKNPYTTCIQNADNPHTSCIPRLGLDLDLDLDLDLGKSSTSSGGSSPTIVPDIPYDKIADLYNSICISLKPISKVTDKRKITIGARYKENKQNITVFETLFIKAQTSDFLKGSNTRGWLADFEWLMNANNMVKVLEGKYDNRQNVQAAHNNSGSNGQSFADMLKDMEVNT